MSREAKRRRVEAVASDDEDGAQAAPVPTAASAVAPPRMVLGRDCPYMNTVARAVLDFDFEKVCSVSLSKQNVYACLACGRYYQGRGRKSHAYFHALDAQHHLFMHLGNGRVFCLPDAYEVRDATLEDIQYNLNPRFTADMIANVDAAPVARAYDGTEYVPGYVGLNDLKESSCYNVVIQVLAHIKPLRNFFLDASKYAACKDEVVLRFGELTRKIWSSRLFKAHVSPHEFLQAVASASKKRFAIGKAVDPLVFLTWLLHRLHTGLGGKRTGAGRTVIRAVFRGAVQVTTRKKAAPSSSEEVESERDVPFMHLSVDLPNKPLVKSELEKNQIPQVPLFSVLGKYDGVTVTHDPAREEWRRYVLRVLPRFLVVHIRRFAHNNFFLEKNPAIVTFPLTNLDMRPYAVQLGDDVESRYDLVANVCHEGKVDEGAYHCHVQRGSEWIQCQDMVLETIMPQLIAVGESYLLVYARKA